jgi:hypothetical protein
MSKRQAHKGADKGLRGTPTHWRYKRRLLALENFAKKPKNQRSAKAGTKRAAPQKAAPRHKESSLGQ